MAVHTVAVTQLDPQIQAVLDAMAAQPPPAEPPSLEEMRAGAAAGHRALAPPPVDMASIETLTMLGPNGDVACLVNTPRESDAPLPVLIYFHGGGLMLLEAEDFQPVCTALAAAADVDAFIGVAQITELHIAHCGDELTNPRASPIHADDHTGLAPAFILLASHDPFYDQGRAYAAVLRAADVPVTYSCHEGTIHAFFTMGGAVDVANAAVAEAASNLVSAFAREA